MSDTRTYIVPDGQENSTNQMLPWMAMMNGGMGGFGNGMWNNPFMYLVWMWMMRWMNNGEWGNGNNCQNLQSAEIQGRYKRHIYQFSKVTSNRRYCGFWKQCCGFLQ